MTNAESIVKEYLARGYSLESLRLLAESRGQPLCGEILAVLEAMAANGELPAAAEDSGPCETAAYPVARGEEGSVFFIADDEEAMAEDGAVDFDVMAGVPASEESVAEIFIGEIDGSGMVADDKPAAETASMTDDAGIWSRLWSRVSGGTAPTVAPSVREDADEAGLLFEEDDAATDAGEPAAAESSASEAVCETVAPAASEAPGVSRAEDGGIEAETPVCGETPVPASEDAEPVAKEPVEPVAENGAPADGEEARMPVGEDVAAQSEISADYIPGSVSDLYDHGEAAGGAAVAEAEARAAADIEAEKRRLGEAQAALAAAAPEVTIETTTASAEAAVPVVPPWVPVSDKPQAKESRRERRRREKAEKKQRKRGKKGAAAAAAVDLPEIVLTRSEGTETMSVAEEIATHEFAVAEAPSQSEGESTSESGGAIAREEAAASLPVPAAEAAMGDEEAAADSEEAPRMSEPMSLLTPNDVIDDDSQAADETSAVAESAQAETTAETSPDAESSIDIIALADASAGELLPVASSEEADADAKAEAGVSDEADAAAYYSGDDHLMIIAGGGVTREECLAARAEAENDADAGLDESVAAEEGGNNVILFSEKFPVFAGVTADDEEDYDDEVAAGTFLRMLPPVDMDDATDADDAVAASDAPAEAALQVIHAETSAEEDVEEVAEASNEIALPLAEDAASAPAAALALAAPEAPEAPEAPRGEVLDDEARAALVRAMLGVGDPADCLVAAAPAADESGGHVIVSMEPEPEPEDALAREAAVREEMEREFQSQLDGFAARLLEVQAVAAANETLVKSGKEELAAKDAVIGEMQSRLDEEAEKQRKLVGKLDKAKGMIREREQDLQRFGGMQAEHERLYKEFEDLRRAYNEVVTDVMPGLQNERDDLALTVERQCAGEEKLRSSLGSMRKRLAVGYSLGAAACLTLIALPVANWIKSGREDKQLAMEHQRISELQETLQREVQQNINAQNVIVELENKVNMARAQINDLQGKNKELARVSQQQQSRQGLAVFKPSESGSPGVPARASDMALQATSQPGGRLHVNEIRDPAGSIEQIAAVNRQQNSLRPDAQMARANGGAGNRPIAMSAVARVDNNGAAAGASRPGVAVASVSGASGRAVGGNAARQRPSSAGVAATAREGEILAKVKKGEGVAQVVYRELGTWDPEVVAWVIRENKIQMDRRGNPRIHPDQTLRLPKGGRVGQAASAAGATRRR